MQYITANDLIERFGEDEILSLADDGHGQIDPIVIGRAIDDASGAIDSHASAGGYPIPLDPVPRIVQAYACDIARYRLYDDAGTDQVNKRYDDAMKFLRAVAKGDVLLGISTTESTSAGSAHFVPGRHVMPGGGF